MVALEELRAKARAVESSDCQHRSELLLGLIKDLHTSIMAELAQRTPDDLDEPDHAGRRGVGRGD